MVLDIVTAQLSVGGRREDRLTIRLARPNQMPSRHRCDHCGKPGTLADLLNGYDCPDRPNGIRLHSGCQVPWMAANSAAARAWRPLS